MIGKTEQQRISTQEQLGRQAAQLEGSFTSFLGDTVSRYLQVLQADPNEAPALSAPLMTTEDYGINLPEFSNFNFDIYGGNQSG